MKEDKPFTPLYTEYAANVAATASVAPGTGKITNGRPKATILSKPLADKPLF